MPRLIDLKEDKFCSAIDHGFVSTEDVETKDAINVSAADTRIARITQGNENATKTHAASCEILREAQGKFLTIDFVKSDITQTALRRFYAE